MSETGDAHMQPTPLSALVVGDTPQSARALGRMLRTFFGLRVRCAVSGEEALQFMRYELPDLLITDCQMPGMSGVELLREVRRRYPDVRRFALHTSVVDLLPDVSDLNATVMAKPISTGGLREFIGLHPKVA